MLPKDDLKNYGGVSIGVHPKTLRIVNNNTSPMSFISLGIFQPRPNFASIYWGTAHTATVGCVCINTLSSNIIKTLSLGVLSAGLHVSDENGKTDRSGFM